MIVPEITKIIEKDNRMLLTVSECVSWMLLSPSYETYHKTIIEDLIKMAQEITEKYTWLSLTPTIFEAYYDLKQADFYSYFQGNQKLFIQRAPMFDEHDVIKIEYLNDNSIWTEFTAEFPETAPGLYTNLSVKKEQRGWYSIYFVEAIQFNFRINAYKMRITFNAGYDNDMPGRELPFAIKDCLKKIVAFNYTNRGDQISEVETIGGIPIPPLVKATLDYYGIPGSVLGGDVQ
jgi:hypothetical protein